MNALQVLSTLAVSVSLAAAPGDRPPAAGRVMAGLAASASGSAGAAGRVPTFTLFGWVSPPVESTTTVRVAEMAACGMTLALPTQGDTAITGRPADNLVRLDLLAGQGMRALVWDERVAGFEHLDPLSPAGLALADSVVATYAGRSALLGWYLGDEPPAGQFDLLGRVRDAFAARDPGHIVWNNLLGRGAFPTRDAWLAYVRDYVAKVRPVVLCDDQYDFFVDHDAGLFVENAAALAAEARADGLPFWAIVLVTPHLRFRTITPGLVAWQTSHLLAYGARGIGYFTYWTPPPDPAVGWQSGLIARDGTHGPLYATVAGLAPRLRAAGITLASLTWLATEHAGSCPSGATRFVPDDWIAAVEGRAALGRFASSDGLRYLLVANSDSSSARTIALTLPHARGVRLLGDAPGVWSALPLAPGDGGARLTLPLEAGDFALLEVDGVDGALRAGDGPGMRAWPRPARGLVRLSYQGLGAGGVLEVLDLAGRRVWHVRPPAGDGLLTWDGTFEHGGVAAAGIYLARFEDARGVAAQRIVWLGR